ncbi:MAG: hypothetical protein K6C94_02305 [Candidatus Gastranaerophilales bacterium]|nr:hypothetical protein [Candidatus Gastranaerophilales bacterium]
MPPRKLSIKEAAEEFQTSTDFVRMFLSRSEYQKYRTRKRITAKNGKCMKVTAIYISKNSANQLQKFIEKRFNDRFKKTKNIRYDNQQSG